MSLRLKKLLKLTASDNDNEAISALRQAQKAVKRSGKTWGEVVDSIPENTNKRNKKADNSFFRQHGPGAAAGFHFGAQEQKNRQQAQRRAEQAFKSGFSSHGGPSFFDAFNYARQMDAHSHQLEKDLEAVRRKEQILREILEGKR